MRFSQLVSYFGLSGVFSSGHVFHNYQASSDYHSRKELMNNDTKMSCCVKIFLHKLRFSF